MKKIIRRGTGERGTGERGIHLCSLFSLLILLLAACANDSTANRQATVDALGRAVVLTATASADEDLSPQNLLATAEAAATEAVSTIAAISTEAAASALTATAVAAAQPTPEPLPPQPIGTFLFDPSPTLSPESIAAELLRYSVDPTGGEIVWSALDAEVEGEGLAQQQPDSPLAAIPLADFVLAADIQVGSAASACGFSLRAADLAQPVAQHLLLLGAIEPGPLALQTWQAGALSPDDARGVAFTDPAEVDPLFSLEPGAINRLAVVVHGETFTIFSNGIQVMAVSPLTQLEAGLVALAGFRETGTAVCRFENAWLWAMPTD